MPTDATADQGGGERVARAIATHVITNNSHFMGFERSAAEIAARVEQDWTAWSGEAQAAIAALPLHASCVEMMEELLKVHEGVGLCSFRGMPKVVSVFRRYRALKAAQELPNAD